jgi:hypothetical protein
MVYNDPSSVPYGSIDRVVLGARERETSEDDWAIAHIANWSNVDPMQLPLATVAALSGPTPQAMTHVAYNRGHTNVHDGTMMYDDYYCGWVESDADGVPGAWARKFEDAPTGETYACNSRWMSGTVFTDCSVNLNDDNVLYHDCELWGGSSGAPMFVEQNGQTELVGVTFGGNIHPLQPTLTDTDCTSDAECIGLANNTMCCGHTNQTATCSVSGKCYQLLHNDESNNPQCEPRPSGAVGNWGPSATRFVHAPWFAESMAIARRMDGSDGTTVFALDKDRNQVAFRQRDTQEFAPYLTSAFDFWTVMPAVIEARIERLAACNDRNYKPVVFTIGRQGNSSVVLMNHIDENSGEWTSWDSIQPPSGGHIADIDTALSLESDCVLYALDDENGEIWAATIEGKWGEEPNWVRLEIAPEDLDGQRIATIRNPVDSFLWIAVVGTNRNLSAFAETSPGSTQIFAYPGISSPYAFDWRDVDFYINKYGEASLFALPVDWEGARLVHFDLPTRANGQYDINGDPVIPNNQSPTSPRLRLLVNGSVSDIAQRPSLLSITADNTFEEDRAPLLLSTDSSGNALAITNDGSNWHLRWQSFNIREFSY